MSAAQRATIARLVADTPDEDALLIEGTLPGVTLFPCGPVGRSVWAHIMDTTTTSGLWLRVHPDGQTFPPNPCGAVSEHKPRWRHDEGMPASQAPQFPDPLALAVTAWIRQARLAQLARETQRLDREWRSTLRQWHAAGASFRTLAEAVGLSHQRVAQLCEEDVDRLTVSAPLG